MLEFEQEDWLHPDDYQLAWHITSRFTQGLISSDHISLLSHTLHQKHPESLPLSTPRLLHEDQLVSPAGSNLSKKKLKAKASTVKMIPKVNTSKTVLKSVLSSVAPIVPSNVNHNSRDLNSSKDSVNSSSGSNSRDMDKEVSDNVKRQIKPVQGNLVREYYLSMQEMKRTRSNIPSHVSKVFQSNADTKDASTFLVPPLPTDRTNYQPRGKGNSGKLSSQVLKIPREQRLILDETVKVDQIIRSADNSEDVKDNMQKPCVDILVSDSNDSGGTVSLDSSSMRSEEECIGYDWWEQKTEVVDQTYQVILQTASH